MIYSLVLLLYSKRFVGLLLCLDAGAQGSFPKKRSVGTVDRRREDRSAEGGGYGEAVSPSHWGRGLGTGLPQKKNSILDLK